MTCRQAGSITKWLRLNQCSKLNQLLKFEEKHITTKILQQNANTKAVQSCLMCNISDN
jgi:hypothetical protein